MSYCITYSVDAFVIQINPRLRSLALKSFDHNRDGRPRDDEKADAGNNTSVPRYGTNFIEYGEKC